MEPPNHDQQEDPMFTIIITHTPHYVDGERVPQALPEARTFAGFRAHTGRRAQSLFGGAPEVTFAGRRQPKVWATKDAAERNVHHLIARGYTARVQEV